jgi:hypothetical protein
LSDELIEELDIDGNPIKNPDLPTMKERSPRKKMVYERSAREEKHTEEFVINQARKKKISELDKRARHLLLFSSIDELNYVNLNKSDVAKAWVALFHFLSKAPNGSVLYDEFESIMNRNMHCKGRSHELFTKFISFAANIAPQY